MRRAMLLALGTMLAAGAAGGGMTLALFSANAGPAEAEMTAGTVRLDGYRDDGDTVDGPMFYITAEAGTSDHGLPGKKPTGFWAPGDSVSRGFVLRNTGSLDAQLKDVSASITGDEALARALEVQICSLRSCTSEVYFSGSLWDLAQSPQEFTVPVVMRATIVPKVLYFTVTLPTTAGNDLQGKTVEAAFQVYAEQSRNNP